MSAIRLGCEVESCTIACNGSCATLYLTHERGGQHILEGDIFPLGSRVRVANDSPLKGLKGTIIAINMIATPGEPTLCFYKIALDNTQLHELLSFEYYEVELVETSCEQPAER
jgi:hypothetical protein